MAQHKAPTAVTIAPTRETTGFALWVERYWKVGALIAIAISVGILFWQYSHQTQRASHDSSWEKLMAVASEDPATGMIAGPPKDLQALDAQVKGTQAGPWTLYIAATSALARRQFEEAKASLIQLRQEYPTHPILTDKFSLDGKSPPVSIADQLAQRIDEQQKWTESHASLFQNLELPPNSPRVRLNTDRGPIVLGLYADLAPRHVENFLKLVREGAYSGTKFHRVIPGFMVQGGDPNTIKGDPTTWGQGGPDYKIDHEDNDLKHFSGVLSAAKQQGESKSSGSQFFITTGDAHHLDGQHVVFGKVLEGMEVITEIEHGPTVQGTDRPEDPVSVQSAEVL